MKKIFFYLCIWIFFFQIENFLLLSFHNSFFVPRFSWVFLVYCFLSLGLWESFLIAVFVDFIFNSLGEASVQYFVLIYGCWAFFQLLKKHSDYENSFMVSVIALVYFYSVDFFLSYFVSSYSPYPFSLIFLVKWLLKIVFQILFCTLFLTILNHFLTDILLWEFFHSHKFKKLNLFAARSVQNFGKRWRE